MKIITFIFFFFSKWEIVLCDNCGSQGTHLHCGKLKSSEHDWMCHDCTSIYMKGMKKL